MKVINQYAPYFLRYLPKTADCGTGFSKLSLSIQFFYYLPKVGNSPAEKVELHRTFDWNIIIEPVPSEDEQKTAVQNFYSSYTYEPPTIALKAMRDWVKSICLKHSVDWETNSFVVYPESEEQAMLFEQRAAKELAREVFTNSPASIEARKLSNAAQDVLNKDVLYIS